MATSSLGWTTAFATLFLSFLYCGMHGGGVSFFRILKSKKEMFDKQELGEKGKKAQKFTRHEESKEK